MVVKGVGSLIHLSLEGIVQGVGLRWQKKCSLLRLTLPSERSVDQRCLPDVAMEIFLASNLVFAVFRAFDARDRSCTFHGHTDAP